MIQRSQTLFILIALGLMIAFLFIPFGYAPILNASGEYVVEPIKALDFTGLTIPTAVSIVTLFIAFLSFKNLSTQKIFTVVSALISAACIGVVIYVITAGYVEATPGNIIRSDWGGGGLFLVAAVLAEIAACLGISSDQRKLRSADRLR